MLESPNTKAKVPKIGFKVGGWVKNLELGRTRSGGDRVRNIQGRSVVHVYWSMAVCMVVGMSGWDWDRIYIILFTIVKGDFLKHELHHVIPFLTNTLWILLGTVLLAVRPSDVESTSWCVAINYVCVVTFRCVSCNLLLIIKCRSLWSIFLFNMNQSRLTLHSLSVSLASEVVSWAEMKGAVLQVSLGELHITWGLS